MTAEGVGVRVRAILNLLMRALFVLLLLALALQFSAQAQTRIQAQHQPKGQPEGQLRGLWVDAYGPGLKSPEEIDTLVTDAQALGLNALFVQVVRRGDCYCLRSALPVSDDPELTPGFDPLEMVTERAHAAGLQVHAWVVTLALWGADAPPEDPEHVYNLHGPNAPDGEGWLNRRYDGVTRPEGDVYLDPGVPAVADYLGAALVSLAQNYDLDGVTFDRLRHPDFNLNDAPSWGYNPVSLARYAAETGAAGLPHPSDPLWTVWRRQQVSLLERRLYLELKQTNPALWVGSATIAYGAPPESSAFASDFSNSAAYRLVLQDWAGWLAGGFLDLNLPMNYKQLSDPREAAWFGAWNRYAQALEAGGLTAVGLGLYRNTPAENWRQIQDVAETPELAGWVGYSYRTPSAETERAETHAKLGAAETARAELEPLLSPLPTAAAFGRPPPVTALLGRVEADSTAAKVETVELLRAGRVVATSPTDAAGVFGFVVSVPKAHEGAADGYLLRLSGGVAVPVPLQAGTVARAPTLTRSPTWYLVENPAGEGTAEDDLAAEDLAETSAY